jgi:hypothetical protein
MFTWLMLVFSLFPMCIIQFIFMAVVWWIYMLVRVITIEPDKDKAMWALLVFFGSFFGATIYWFARGSKYKKMRNDLIINLVIGFGFLVVNFGCWFLTTIVPLALSSRR